MIVPRNADGRESDALPGDARRARRQVRAGAPSQLALSAVDRVLDLNHRSRLDQIDAALAAVGLRLDVGVAAIRSGSRVLRRAMVPDGQR